MEKNLVRLPKKCKQKALSQLNRRVFVALFLACMCFSNWLYCQEKSYVQQVIDENFSKIEIPVLSQSEMYADFDTLRYLLKNVYPYYYIKSQLCATDYDKKLAELRSQISDIQQMDDFIWILQKAINLFCDDHLNIPHFQTLKYYHENESKFGIELTPENIVCTHKYYLITHNSLQSKIKLGMRFKYLDNKYLNIRAFKYKNQIYPEGILLKSINGMSIDTFVDCFYASMWGAAYDYKNKKYFADYFFVSPEFLNIGTYLLVFEDSNKNILKDTFYVDVQVENISKQRQPQNDKSTVFTVSDSILYVRIPSMSGDGSFYIQEIQKLYNEEHIRKILIDVRGNTGGTDMVWRNILSAIISDTIRQNSAIYAQNTTQIRDYLYRNETDSIQTKYLPLLKSEIIKINEKQGKISPHENSIRFKGKIVFMQDENSFSAAGKFSAIAKENDNVICMGYRMNNIGGQGLSPLLFQLPHSNMLIRMPFVIDYTGVNQISDFLRNVPQIECKRSISAFLRSYYSENPYQLESLLQDECFLEAISL